MTSKLSKVVQEISLLTNEKRHLIYEKIMSLFLNYSSLELQKEIEEKEKITFLNYVETICKNIEESIYQYAVHRCLKQNLPVSKYILRYYLNKCVSLYDNLKPDSYIKNKDLLKKVLHNQYNVERLAFYKPVELFPEHWKDIIERKMATEAFLYQDHEMIETDRYVCKRCKKNRCSFMTKQVRSADEPSTTFIRCLSCQNKWTEG